MSNDIRPDLVSHVGAQKGISNDSKPSQNISDNINYQEKNASGAMDILSAQGCAQVNMNNSNKGIKALMEQYKQNPQLIEDYIYFCDNLVNEGRSLEQAIKSTDIVFATLKNEELYH